MSKRSHHRVTAALRQNVEALEARLRVAHARAEALRADNLGLVNALEAEGHRFEAATRTVEDLGRALARAQAAEAQLAAIRGVALAAAPAPITESGEVAEQRHHGL